MTKRKINKKGLKMIPVTPAMMECLKENTPSGGWYREYCMNSAIFKKRKCKMNGKMYEAGEVCPCFDKGE